MPADTWQRYKTYFCQTPVAGGIDLDISRMHFPDDLLSRMAAPLDKAFSSMDALEKGAIANPDENRMVGHYWLRNPQLAPTPEIRSEIEHTLARIKAFAADIHSGKRRAQGGVPFDSLLVIGIGGSALGPEFVSDALATPDDKMSVHFFDNTDPDGFDKTLAAIPNLARTLTLVISKSGGTKETRNGMLAAAAAYKAANLTFAKHAVAITGDGSELDKVAVSEQWLERFPMWDWVGGRTSELSAVGLLPAALQGIDIDALLAGARDMDAATRSHELRKNPAALMALMWHHAGSGKGLKDMVVLPYKDRLLLFSRYLQQLVMESLGKEKDRSGNTVHQGIAVYGNKGSTDQHAYVQQLREGINNFFVTFIEVLHDATPMSSSPGTAIPGQSAAFQVEPDVTSGDYLHGFFQGTRRALAENNRESLTITVHQLSPNAIGALIALFERAVGLYAELININAYHQPGVEAGKKAATAVIALQRKLLAALRDGKTGTADQLAAAIGSPDESETAFLTLRHLAANPASTHIKIQGAGPTATFSRA
ncbi:MAG TPA: glucose-6-phosphate isomerase [Phycisphaerae bacterium]|nr:glucose-6-phosphate isomerase [Phycisphaerae bacterium]